MNNKTFSAPQSAGTSAEAPSVTISQLAPGRASSLTPTDIITTKSGLTATLYLADCLSVLPGLVGVDAVVADPPYGCAKAEWDAAFPTAWYEPSKAVAKAVYTITGSVGLKDSMALCGADVVDVIAARNMNALTRGPIGFSNWLATVCVGKKPKQGPNAFDFAVRGDMPDHPSPKPIQFMVRLLNRLFDGGELLCDPFMGSGTTGVAALRMGCNFIGVEISDQYYQIAKRRIQAEADQGNLFQCENTKRPTPAHTAEIPFGDD